jgi:hypothetical protein
MMLTIQMQVCYSVLFFYEEMRDFDTRKTEQSGQNLRCDWLKKILVDAFGRF